jgi:hypothetical protein
MIPPGTEVQIRSSRVTEDGRCRPTNPCQPLQLAIRKSWIFALEGLPSAKGSDRMAVCAGDAELGIMSLFRYCPFCGVSFETFDKYLNPEDEKKAGMAFMTMPPPKAGFI